MAEPAPKRSRKEFEYCKKVLSLVEPANINYASKFAIMKITECNASQKYSFTEAKCNVVMAGEDAYPFYLEFLDVFSKGEQLLNDLKNNTRILEEYEERSVSILDNYLKEIELHEMSLQKVLMAYNKERDRKASGEEMVTEKERDKKPSLKERDEKATDKEREKRVQEKEGEKKGSEREKDRKNPELELTLAFAEHLLGKLAPGKSYTVDTHVKIKGKCTCGFDHCQSEPEYGGTGIGDVNAWHGFMDIVFASHSGLPDNVGVGVAVSTTESHDTEDENADSLNCSPGGKGIDIGGSEDQAVAQTIVYSFIQRNRHPRHQTLIPNILISSSYFRIIMYDSVEDVLLCTAPIPLFRSNMREKLVPQHVIILWMVLHYRMFCSGIKKDLVDNMEKIRLNFKNLAKDKYNIYLNLSQVGIRHFPAVSQGAYPSFQSFCGGIHLASNR